MPDSSLATGLAAASTQDLWVLWLKFMATGISVTLLLFAAVFTSARRGQQDERTYIAFLFTLANAFAAIYIGADAMVRLDVLLGDFTATLFWYKSALSAIVLSVACYISLYWAIHRRLRRPTWPTTLAFGMAGAAAAIVWVEHPSLVIASDALTVRDMSVFADYGLAAPWYFAAALGLFLWFCLSMMLVNRWRMEPLGRQINLLGFVLLLAAATHDALRELGVYLLPFGTLGLGYMLFQVGAFAFLALHYSHTLRDSRRQESRIEDLSEAVSRDKLSGLFSRSHLEERLDRQEVVAGGGLLFLDVDDFKRINDRYGHTVGDAVIKAVGSCLADNVRGQDMACRWGGDEFLVYLAQTDPAGVRALVERLRAAVRAISLPQAPGMKITLSLGYATLGDGDWRSRLSRADQAMYDSKQAGKNRLTLV